MRIRACDMRRKYWEIWVAVEAGVWDDLCLIRTDIEAKALRRIAHNAAFLATAEHHKALQAEKARRK